MKRFEFAAVRERVLRNRRAAFRLSAMMGMGVVVCLLLLGGLGRLFGGMKAGPQRREVTALKVAEIAPPPPPPPVADDAPEPEPEPELEMPALPPMDTGVSRSSTGLSLPELDIDVEAGGVPAAVPAVGAAAAAPEVVRPGRGSSPPRRLIVPDLRGYYPRRLVDLGIEGRTRVRAFVSASGAVERVEVITSVPPNRFERAARRAMAAVRYEPARDASGRAVPGVVVETLQWRNPK